MRPNIYEERIHSFSHRLEEWDKIDKLFMEKIKLEERIKILDEKQINLNVWAYALNMKNLELEKELKILKEKNNTKEKTFFYKIKEWLKQNRII